MDGRHRCARTRGNPTLWSGNASNLDSAAVTPVTVPADNPTLTFIERHLAEEGYDYAYTVVSTDGGKTYTPLANANTVDGPLGPALNGDAAGFATQTFDLRAYAGQTILIGFRYVSDGGVNDGGWYVDDIKVGATLVSDGSHAGSVPVTDPDPPGPGGELGRPAGRHRHGKHRSWSRVRRKVAFSLDRRQLKQFQTIRRWSRSSPTTTRPSRCSSSRRTRSPPTARPGRRLTDRLK